MRRDTAGAAPFVLIPGALTATVVLALRPDFALYAALAMVGLVFALVVASSVSLRYLLLASLLFLTFEGLLKNISHNHPVSYLVRDGFLGVMLVRWYLERRPGRGTGLFPTAFHGVLVIFIALSVVQIFNPALDQYYWVVGLAGIHQRLLPMVLFLVVWDTMRDHRTFDLAWRVIVASAVIVGAVLLLQIGLGEQRWRAMGFSFYAQGASAVPSAGVRRGVARPASIAKDAGMAAWFLMAGAFAALGSLLQAGRRSTATRSVMLAIVTGFLAMCLLLTYSRSAYLAFIGGLVLMVAASQGTGRLRILVTAVVGAGLVGAAIQLIPDAHTGAVVTRLQVSVLNPIGSFTAAKGGRINQLKEIPDVLFDNPVGIGAGRTGPGASVLRRWFPGVQADIYENAAGAIALELGVPGFLLWLAIYGVLFWSGVRALLRIRDPAWRPALVWSLAVIAASFVVSLTMNPWDAAPANTYFWVAAGVVMRVAVVARQQAQAAATPLYPATGGTPPSRPLTPAVGYGAFTRTPDSQRTTAT